MKQASSLRLSKLSLGLLAVLAAAPAFAQSTSSALTGRVLDADGRPVAGAVVVIEHTESGTSSTATTDANGRYTVRNLRVGGPYKVTADKGGATDVENGVYLALDTTNNIDLQVGGAAAPARGDLGTINVVGTAVSPVFTPETTGAATSISRQQIEALPSVRRSIEDYVRMDPRIVQVDKERGGIAAAGQNNRYNNIRVDGVPTNDNFGLNDSGVPALNQPIVIDWIESFNVSVSNYDVTQGDFVGANVNAVTKSGTNEFHGAVYGLYRNKDMIGDWLNGKTIPKPYRSETTWGGYFGGPLIQDRLFFFAGYEKYKRQAEAVSNGIAGSGALNEFRITQAQIDQIRAKAASLGATDIGSFAPLNNIDNEDTKVLVKLDWNITDTQRAAIRYNRTKGNVLRQNQGITTLQADSNRYQDNILFENWAAMLYSDWSENFSTEANISYSTYSSLPTAFSNMPEVSITVPGGAPNGDTATIVFGKEFSRQTNVLKVNTRTAYVAGNWYLGDHELKFGADYESSDIYNLFLQASVGSYTFGNTGRDATFRSGLDNYMAGLYTRYTFNRAVSGNNEDTAARFKIGNLGLFLQDTWKVNDKLTLIYGVRADRTTVDGKPQANARFLTDYGIDNTNTPDGRWTFSPRVGFNYTTTSANELMTQVRGGVGLFVGSAPGVWLSNSFSNPGVLANSYLINASNGAAVPANGLGSASPVLQLVPSQTINAMTNDFRQPTVWKANLAIDQQLPWWGGLTAGVELLMTRVRDGIRYINYGTGNPTGTLPDGRPHYWNNPALGTNAIARAGCLLVDPAKVYDRNTNPCRYANAFVLANTDQGHAENLTFSLEKPWANGWFAKLAYTVGSSREVNPGTSSTASSNWSNAIVFVQNGVERRRSNYEIDQRLTFAASKKFNFFGNEKAATTFSMFYEGRNGRPYSYVFGGDANGDGISGNDAFYVPRDMNDVAFTTGTTAADKAAFFSYLESNADLAARRGFVMQRNSARSPWRNIVDVRIQQDLPLGFAGAKAQLFFDIENVGNLLNKRWGQVQEAPFPYRVFMPNYAGVNAQGKYVLDAKDFTTRNMALPYRNVESVWSAQVGFRLTF